MTEIEGLINDGRALQNITDGNPLRQNDDRCRHQIVIFIKIVSNAALGWEVHSSNSQIISLEFHFFERKNNSKKKDHQRRKMEMRFDSSVGGFSRGHGFSSKEPELDKG